MVPLIALVILQPMDSAVAQSGGSDEPSLQPATKPAVVRRPARLMERIRRAIAQEQHERAEALLRERFQFFRTVPEDWRAVEAEEVDALMAVAREYAPYVFRQLRRMERRNEEVFQRQLGNAAPRLRRLQRVAARDPQLARLFVRHTELKHDVSRARRGILRSTDRTAEFEDQRGALRALFAELVRVEIGVLERGAAVLEREHDEIVREVVGRMLEQRGKLGRAALSPNLRSALEDVDEADASTRTAVESLLRDRIADRVSAGVERLRSKAVDLGERAGAEVDARVEALREQIEQGRRGHRHRERGSDP